MSSSFASEIELVVSYFKSSRMSFYRLRLKYVLEDSSKYITWKDRMEGVLEYN